MNNQELVGITIALLFTIFIVIISILIVTWHTNSMITQQIYEKACAKAEDMNIIINNNIDPYNPCDINLYGTIFQINYFCEKVNPSFCDFNIVLLNETVIH
jgi:hypothetical protein